MKCKANVGTYLQRTIECGKPLKEVLHERFVQRGHSKRRMPRVTVWECEDGHRLKAKVSQ